MKQIRKRLTYANVMSSIAVFLVIGGATAFAANQLGKNTVGSKQLKKNAVTATKIKNNAITSAKVKDGSLLSSDFKAGQLPTGSKGEKGETGGIDLSHATRVAFVPASSDSPISATTTPFATTTITAPTRGLLVAQTSLILFSETPASCPCVIQTQLALDGGGNVIVGNSNLGTTATDYVGGFDRRPTGGAEVFTVGAGQHTIVAQSFVQTSSSLSGLGTSDETLQVFFVPFNGAGATP